MLRIVLPTVPAVPTSIAARRQSGGTIAAPQVTPVTAAKIAAISATSDWIRRTIAIADVIAATDIRVAVEIVVAVDGDVIVTTPTTAPSPAPPPEGPHHDSDSERDGHACGVISVGRIINRRIRIDRRPVHDHGIIRGHVDHLRVGLLDDDNLLGLDN